MDTVGIELKHCWSCKEVFPATTQYFHRDSSKGGGLHGSCKWCTRSRKAKWQEENSDKVAANKKRFFNSHYQPHPRINKKATNAKHKWFVKECGCCLVCGEQRPEVLIFHHREPKEKSFSLHRSGSRLLEEVKIEIAKCDLMCTNCHASLHYWEKHK